MKVELQLSPDPAERITRAADKEAIRDINLYLFGRSNGQSLHFYFRSALVRFECLPGEYDLYVAANLGADLGERSAQQLLDYTIGRQEEYATLPMSAVMTVAIAPRQREQHRYVTSIERAAHRGQDRLQHPRGG